MGLPTITVATALSVTYFSRLYFLVICLPHCLSIIFQGYPLGDVAHTMADKKFPINFPLGAIIDTLSVTYFKICSTLLLCSTHKF